MGKIYTSMGLMSGTSLDGLDLCCVRFSSNLKDFQILESKTVSYTDKWKSKLENAFFDSAGEIDILDNCLLYTSELPTNREV